MIARDSISDYAEPPMAGAATLLAYPIVSGAALLAPEASPPLSRPPRLLDRVRLAIRPQHSSRRILQELLGRRGVSTTQIYTRVLNRDPAGVRSPAERMFL